MAAKRQFMVLIEPDTMYRLDALRIVTGEARARVGERAWLEGGLRGLERQHHPRLARLHAVARAHGQTWQEFVDAYAEAHKHKTYGTPLEKLEEEAGIAPAQV